MFVAKIGRGFRDFEGVGVYIIVHNEAYSMPIEIGLGPTERHCMTSG